MKQELHLYPDTPPRTEAFLSIDGLVEGGRTRGMLQVQDGCDEHCTYCIIPSVRGQSVSRPDKQIVKQARTMVAAGYRELALTWVHTGSYGYDVGNRNGLVDLLEALEQIRWTDRIRLNSVEPAYVSDALIALRAGQTSSADTFTFPCKVDRYRAQANGPTLRFSLLCSAHSSDCRGYTRQCYRSRRHGGIPR